MTPSISNSTALTTLYCYDNQLTSLDVSNNTALTTLWCYYNQLTSLDVSNNTALTRLDCSPMDVNGVNQLATLYIAQDQEIPHITSDRNASYIPEGTEIIVDSDDTGAINLSSSNGDYVSPYWTSGYEATFYNVNVPNVGESQPDNCLFQSDINASFVTYSPS